MTNKLRFTAFIAAVSILANSTVFASGSFSALQSGNDAVSESDIVLNETYEDYPTGDQVVIRGGLGKIVDISTNDKALCMLPSDSVKFLKERKIDFVKDYVAEIEIKDLSASTFVEFGISPNDKNVLPLISIEKGTVKNYYGSKLFSIGADKNVKLAFSVHTSGYYDVYYNGDVILQNNRLPGEITYGDVVFAQKSYKEELTVDNFRIYFASAPKKNFPKKEYNPEKYDGVYVNNDVGDRTFFDSTNADYSKGTYANAEYTDNGNIVECGRLDLYNPNRKNNYIHIEKKNTNQIMFNVKITKFSSFRQNDEKLSPRKYSYFLIDGDFKIDEWSNTIYMPMIIDMASPFANLAQSIAIVQNGGAIKFLDSTVMANLIEKGKWFNLKVALNLEKKTADIYIDGKLVKSLNISDEFETLSRVRIQFAQGSDKGKMDIDNFTVTGLVKPFENGVDTPTGIYSDESQERAFLSDKAAFNINNSLMYANGEKTKMDVEPYFENGDFYIGINSLCRAFGLENKDGKIYNGEKELENYTSVSKDGEIFIPVMSFAKDMLGKESFYHEQTGVIIISDKQISFKGAEDWLYPSERVLTKYTILNDLDFISWFLNYERPSAQTLKDDMIKTIGSLDVHPRIMINDSKIKEIKALAEKDEKYRQVIEKYIEYADYLLTKEVATYRYGDKTRMTTDRSIIMALGFAYNYTGDKKYLKRGYDELYAITKFPDYDESGMLFASDWAVTLGIGFDWLYNGLTAEQRDYLSERMMNHSLKPFAKGYYGRLSGRAGIADDANFKWISNMCAVSSTGPFFEAAALAEYDPDYCFDIMEKCIRAYEYPLALVAPGGGWPEGVGYWDYAFVYMASAMLAMKEMCGSYYGLDTAKGFDNMQYAVMAVIGPGGANPVGDMDATGKISYEAYNVISRICNNPLLQSVRVDDILSETTSVRAMDVIAYTPFDTETEGSHIAYAPGDEILTIRENPNPKSDTLYFSTHFGKSSGYHAHLDTGTFVLDMLGERWAEDIGRDDYNLQQVLGYKWWDLYRMRAEGHNVLVINPSADGGQTKGEYTKIEKYDANDYGGFVTADLSKLYEDANSVKVGYYVDDNMRSVTVKYEIDLPKESEMYWFMHTKANAAADGNKVFLTKNGKSMFMSFDTDAESLDVSVTDAVPLASSPSVPEQNKNLDYKKVAAHFKGNGKVNFTVKIAPSGEGISMDEFYKTAIDEWVLPVQKKSVNWSKDLKVSFFADGKEVSDNIDVYGKIPEVSVSLSNPEMSYEIDQSSDEKAVVKVYNSDKSEFIYYALSYIMQNADIAKYNPVNVVSVEASAEPQVQNGKDNMIDNDMSTRWTSFEPGDYAVFDLGKSKEISAVMMSFWNANSRNYYLDIMASPDGVNYRTVLNAESEQTEDTKYSLFEFDPVNARYIKVVSRGNSTNKNMNITECKPMEKRAEG